jgi:hypothetical protein
VRAQVRGLLPFAAGALLPAAAMLAYFAARGALLDLYLATVTYNLRYSGQTYAGPAHAARYLLTFPIGMARVDPLWFVGGLGCAVLLVAARMRRDLWMPVGWVAAACVSIAANGSRGLPQYFIQAGPALALAAGAAGAWAWPRAGRILRAAVAVALVIGVWRVADVRRGFDYTWYDFEGLTGALTHDAYLSRYGRADSGDKYSALAVHQLAGVLAGRTRPSDPVFVFGFSPWAYVGSGRASASRFFWSRPVIVGFEAGRPGYGVSGMLDDLRRHPPAVVALQRRDWDPDGLNSDEFWRRQPALVAWLDTGYARSRDLHNFEIWMRRGTR